MALLLDNPRRRRSKRRRSSSKRRRSSARRKTRTNPAPTPKRRRRGARRKKSSRRYRRNPMGLPSAGGALKAVTGIVPSLASVWAGDAITAVAKSRIPFLRGVSWPLIGIGVALVGAEILKRFGGPLRKHAASFRTANLLWAGYNAIPYQFGGYGTAQKLKLAPMIGASGATMADYAIAGGDPSYGHMGSPQLYDYMTPYEGS